MIHSLFEGYPLVAWEMMLLRLPFVMTDVGAAREFRRNNQNVLVADLDPISIAHAVEEMATRVRKNLVSALGQRKHCALFDRSAKIRDTYLPLVEVETSVAPNVCSWLEAKSGEVPSAATTLN